MIAHGLEPFAALSRLGPMSLTRLRLLKMGAVVRHPAYWRPFLTERVLPTAEFESLPFLPEIRTVLDVGANRGQFALFASHRFPGATIHMFEPVPEAAATARRIVPSATMHQCALGETSGELEFYAHPDSDQSSALPLVGATKIRVPVARLDAVDLRLTGPVLLKMDVQGFEPHVLLGASGIMDRIDQVLCEVSAQNYLDGAPGVRDLLECLSVRGFMPRAAGPLMRYGTDALFSR
jgi:FkbM family methyltransferase